MARYAIQTTFTAVATTQLLTMSFLVYITSGSRTVVTVSLSGSIFPPQSPFNHPGNEVL